MVHHQERKTEQQNVKLSEDKLKGEQIVLLFLLAQDLNAYSAKFALDEPRFDVSKNSGLVYFIIF